MTTLELISYYANLLILQYVGKPKAYATMQTVATPIVMPQVSTQDISFSDVAASGTFVLSYNEVNTASINWNDSAGTIQSKLRAITGLSTIVVEGSIASKLLTVTFTGVTPPAALLAVESNSLENGSSDSISIDVEETDETLPLAVQNAFNLIGPNPAVGVQLDVLGKYTGVIRTGYSLSGAPITLNDSDFLILIQFSIARNNAGSSLSQIQAIFQEFFPPGAIYVFDYANMHMSYLIDSDLGSQDLVQLLVTEGLLPKPMGVQLAAVIYVPVIDAFFGFRTYLYENDLASPFNTYADYQTDWPWLSYQDAIVPLSEILTQSGDAIVQENGDFIYLG